MSMSDLHQGNKPTQSFAVNEEQQYLVFALGNAQYGIDILRVKEIRAWQNVTNIPNTPDYLSGVTNLHGEIVPIVDLRLRLGMAAKKDMAMTEVIMVQVNDRWQRTVGVVVDEIIEDKSVLSAELLPVKDVDSQLDIQFIKGLVTGDDSMIVMDIDKLLSLEALG